MPSSARSLHDLSGGKMLLPPGPYLLPRRSAHPVTLDSSLGDGLAKVDLPVEELVSEKVDIPEGVAEPLCHQPCRKPLHDRCPKCFIPPLPFMDRAGEIGRIVHEVYIPYDAEHVNKYL